MGINLVENILVSALKQIGDAESNKFIGDVASKVFKKEPDLKGANIYNAMVEQSAHDLSWTDIFGGHEAEIVRVSLEGLGWLDRMAHRYKLLQEDH